MTLSVDLASRLFIRSSEQHFGVAMSSGHRLQDKRLKILQLLIIYLRLSRGTGKTSRTRISKIRHAIKCMLIKQYDFINFAV